MPLLGLVGYPLSHSFSPSFFREKFKRLELREWDYGLLPLPDITKLPALLQDHQDLIAFNVTIPHKQSILPYCDVLSDEVKEIGAANLVLIEHLSGNKTKLHAFNTDSYGFSGSLSKWYENHGGKALVLGSGGASKAIQYSLRQLHIPFDVTGRHLPLSYNAIELHSYELIINCTPVGMKKEGAGTSGLLPLPYDQVHAGQYFYDLVYNPAVTAMMTRFLERGARVKNGLEMLHLQAERSWDIISFKRADL